MVLLGLLLIVLLAVIGFAIVGGCVWVICWAFGFVFSWKIVAGVYAVICLLQMVFNGSGGDK